MKNIQIPVALAAILCLPAVCPAQSFPTYTITTVAGNNTAGYAGDAGLATAAELSGPTAVWVDSSGNIYIADQFNARIRLVTASTGNITTVAGNGTPGFLGDTGSNDVLTASSAEINGPDAIILDSKGNLYIADTGNSVIRMVTPGGAISTFAGNGGLIPGFGGDGGLATAADLYHPAGIAMDSAGNLYISDNGNNRIRKVNGPGVTNPGYILTIVDESGNVGFLAPPSYTTPNGGALTARIDGPRAMAVDSSGNLYFADSLNNMIRKVAPPTTAGTITLVAGSPVSASGYTGDGGQAAVAALNDPTGVAVDTCGNVYIADSRNNAIRMVNTNGVINTIAGGNGTGYSGDGGPALNAQLYFPAGVAVDTKGNVYVADTQNAVIRKLTPTSGAACGATGKPPAITAGGVVSASAFGDFPGVAAPGSWIEIYGSNLADNTRQWAASDFSVGTNGVVNAPTSLDRTSVIVAGQPAFIYFISPGQIDAQVPANTGNGPLQLTVSTSVGSSAPMTINVSTVQPGLWAPAQFNVGGKQYVGATHVDGTFVAPVNEFGSNYTSSPAKPGETITFWGIGFGSVSSGTAPGQIAEGLSNLSYGSGGTCPGASPIQFNFGTAPNVVSGAPTYCGLAPGLVGLYQFNVVVPSVPNNDLVPLTFIQSPGNSNAVFSTQTLYTAVHN